jgi:very-short-patch-repair endonuclease
MIARLQRGRVSRRQLMAAGISSDAVDRRVHSGYLLREHRAVFVVGHLAHVPWGAEPAALLSIRDGAALSHHTAARLWGLRGSERSQVVHVTVEGSSAGRRRGVVIHRTRVLHAKDLRIREGLPVTSPARALLEVAPSLSDRELELALDQGIVAGILRSADVAEMLERTRGNWGWPRLAALVERQRDPTLTRSEPEERLLALVRKADLPDPRLNVRLHGYEVDFHWPAQNLVVEVDGFRSHSTHRAFEHDRRKDATLGAAGVATMRVTWRQIEDEPYAVVARLALALARARAQSA